MTRAYTKPVYVDGTGFVILSGIAPEVVDVVTTFAASAVTSGIFDLARIPDLPASKTTSGAFAVDRIPDLPASKTTSGAFAVDRIPDLPATKITSGTLSRPWQPSGSASLTKITVSASDPVSDDLADGELWLKY